MLLEDNLSQDEFSMLKVEKKLENLVHALKKMLKECEEIKKKKLEDKLKLKSRNIPTRTLSFN